MNKKQITFEDFSYLIIFGLALFMRLLMLGKAPLSEFEATWAYQAWELAQGQISNIGLQAGYLTLTEGLFSLWGGTNALARFWPALAGSLLVLVPFLFRAKLGREAALIMALGLALDPGFVSISRLAGGPMLAVAFLALACGLLWAGRPAWAVFFGGMALLSGPSLWMGALGIALTLGVGHLLGALDLPSHVRGWISTLMPKQAEGRSIPWRLVIPLGAVVMLGTFFLQHYQGLSAWLSAFPAFWEGWGRPSGVPAGRLVVALLAYQPLALIFGLITAVRGFVKGEKTTSVLGFWFVAALGLALIYPGRQVYDLLWGLIPLWGLAGMELACILKAVKSSWVTRLHAAFVFILFTLAWLSFVNLILMGVDIQRIGLQWGIVGATFLLMALVTVIVAGEWGWIVARRGLVVGVSVALGLYVLSSTMGAAYSGQGDPRELWYPCPGGSQVKLLQESLGDVGLLETGRQEQLEIVVLDGNEVLAWALRGYSEVSFRDSTPMDRRPPVVITRESEASQPWTAAYLGQDFVLRTSQGWGGAIPADWKNWIVFREAPLEKEKSILWVRWDLFPFMTEEEVEEDTPLFEEINTAPFED